MLHQKELLLKARVLLRAHLQKNHIEKTIRQETLDHLTLKVVVKETQETDADNASFFCFLLATFVNQIRRK